MQNNIKILLTTLILMVALTACNNSSVDNTVNTTGTTTLVAVPKNQTTRNTKPQTDLNWLADYSSFIKMAVDENDIPGVAVAVVQGNETLLAQGFGFQDIEEEIPVTTKTLFHIGSTNKSLTALMVATLVDKGLFQWDTPVIQYYPNFALADPEATNTVTMRHLLSMQSGLPAAAEDDFDIEQATAEDVIPFLANVSLLGLPGQEFSYSNLSSAASGYLAVLAANKNSNNLYNGYLNLLTEQVLHPIGMTSAVLRVSQAKGSPHYGKSYTLDDYDDVVEAEPEDFDGDPLAPSGTLKANVLEMGLYISTQLNKGIAPNGTRVVSEKNLTELWQPYLENYGMGWEITMYKGIKIISHEGSFDNYLSVIGFMPTENIGFVVLSNGADMSEDLIATAPFQLVDFIVDSR